jgi:formate hydrogenlyase subunit 3/multisubunit Na+/H+ antiporter MnhD subunit
MLDIIFIVLVVFAILLMLYAISERNTALCIIDSIFWFILALFMIQGIETPYTMFNSTSGNIESGMNIVTSNLSPISYLFMGLGAIMFILFITFAMEYMIEYNKMNKR